MESECKNWELGNCTECRRIFFRDEYWKNTCPICFKITRSYSLYKTDKQILLLQEAFYKLTDDCRQHIAETERWKSRATKLKKVKGEVAPFDKKMLRRLLFLCHPDKHKGSDKALEMTQWLLKLGEK